MKDRQSNMYLGPCATCPLYVFDNGIATQVNMRHCVMQGLQKETVVTFHRVLNLVEMFLRACQFIRNQGVLNVRVASLRSLLPMCIEEAAILFGRYYGSRMRRYFAPASWRIRENQRCGYGINTIPFVVPTWWSRLSFSSSVSRCTYKS